MGRAGYHLQGPVGLEWVNLMSGSIACVDCDAANETDGPVPNEKDRTRWLDSTGRLVECPMCDEGEIYWEENWLAGGSPMWRARSEACEHCEGSGELTVHDRCETCGRLEQSCGKGPERIVEADRLHDHLS